MKVLIEDLVENPFRKLEKYPIDPYKVEALKTSIEETTFWDNILTRERNGKFQIAYGHHRLIALRELKIKEVDIPVKDISDADMIRIMANENMDDWNLTPAVINETVAVAKEYLDGELKKCDSWEHLNNPIKVIFGSNSQFQQCKKDGVGQTTLLKFLGKNWKQHRIQQALEDLREEYLVREAAEVFETQNDERAFKAAIKNNPSFPKEPEKQKEIAKRTAKKIKENKKKHPDKTEPIRVPIYVEQAIAETEGKTISEEEVQLKNLENEMKLLKKSVKHTTDKIEKVNKLLEDMQVQEIRGLEALLQLDSLSEIMKAIQRLLKHFGLDYKNLNF